MVEPAQAPLVSILIVTFNSAKTLAACLDTVSQQDYAPLETIIVDNNSADETGQILASCKCQVLLNSENRGFAAAQNQAMRAARGEWLLCLNPDVLLSPNFVSTLMAERDRDPSVGTLCGKLLRWVPQVDDARTNIIDSTGIEFRRNLRHLDRGAEQADRGQFDQTEYVFGATGAAALYRRRMVEEVSVEGEVFDESFFSFREDADLAWRAQLLGWHCLYVPAAVAWHQRRVTPERRASLPHEINWHSVKNRFLMRDKNAGFGVYWRTFFPTLSRDALILGYAALRDWRMFSALWYPLAHLREVWRKRRWIQSRRRVTDADIVRWFR